jgi:hypothetical protein
MEKSPVPTTTKRRLRDNVKSAAIITLLMLSRNCRVTGCHLLLRSGHFSQWTHTNGVAQGKITHAATTTIAA